MIKVRSSVVDLLCDTPVTWENKKTNPREACIRRSMYVHKKFRTVIDEVLVFRTVGRGYFQYYSQSSACSVRSALRVCVGVRYRPLHSHYSDYLQDNCCRTTAEGV